MTDILKRLEDFSLADVAVTDPLICRPLEPGEVSLLERAGCGCADWTGVQVTRRTDLTLISRCRFAGTVRIDLPGGTLSDCSIEDCVLAGPLSVKSTGLVKGYTLSRGSAIEYCGSIVWQAENDFLKGSVQGGVETGERSMPLIPLMDHGDAAWLASGPGREQADRAAALHMRMCGSAFGYIGEGVLISCCRSISDSVFLEGSSAEAALAVRDSLLLQGASARDGAVVRNSVLQWNSTADTMAVVEQSVLGENSVVEKHGKLSSSFLGADSALGEGEITASVVGPLTGMHHQSLLIASLWPEGKGNIGYGANVGSNHTSRLPDQELRPGAGMFFGLGCSVKFPADFTESPYSVIATGVTTMPQKISYPFSLILPGDGALKNVPSGWSRLVPGWMLHSNLYSVLRNRWKYSLRSRAVNTAVASEVFTPAVMKMVEKSLEMLREDPEGGAGCCYITEKDRTAGIEAYSRLLRAFELRDLMVRDQLTEEQKAELLDLAVHAWELAVKSRTRDFTRGLGIIQDYGDVRLPPGEDPFLIVLNEEIEALKKGLRN